MHPKFQSFLNSNNKSFNTTIELIQGRKNPIIKIALIGPEKTPNKDKAA
jgi:hypothetical protein